MKNPGFNRTFILQTDASGVGVGAVLWNRIWTLSNCLFQSKIVTKRKVILKSKKRMSSIVLAVKHFRAYLLRRPFVVQTDHWTLQWLHQFKEKNAKLTMWSLTLQPYNFTVQHKKDWVILMLMHYPEWIVSCREGGRKCERPMTLSQDDVFLVIISVHEDVCYVIYIAWQIADPKPRLRVLLVG